MIPGFPGPKDHWEVELEKVSKLGLIDLIESIAAVYLPYLSRETWLKNVLAAKKMGRFLNAMKQHDEYRADPDRWFAKKSRQRASAKKAARRIKRQKKGTA
jgi:hypothetical protein